jgi:hypothetical protein
VWSLRKSHAILLKERDKNPAFASAKINQAICAKPMDLKKKQFDPTNP